MSVYHDEYVKTYANIVAGKSDDDLLLTLRWYAEGGSSRHYLFEREDHRSWRRHVIREALRRGLIDEDPGDAP